MDGFDPVMSSFELNVNGRRRSVDVESDTPLLWVLRDSLGLAGTKYGCGIGQCGACTVHLDGRPVRSCTLPVTAAVGREVTTIEGLAEDGSLTPLQEAWCEHDVAQCGYCQSGQIMAAAALLRDNPRPDVRAIDQALAGNFCRCATYTRIRQAILTAAEQ